MDATVASKIVRSGFILLLFPLVLSLVPYTHDAAGPVKILVYVWGGALLLTFWFIASLVTKSRVARPPLFSTVLVAFLGLYLLSALLSPYWGNSLTEVRRFAALFAVYFLAAQVYRTPQQVHRTLLAVCGAVAVGSAYGFAQRFGWDPFPWADRQSADYLQIPASFGHPNYAAHALVPALIAAAYLATQKKFRWAIGFAAVFGIHLFLTGQRGGPIALAAAFVLAAAIRISVAKDGQRRRRMATLLIGAALLLVLGVPLGLKLATGSFLPSDKSVTMRVQSYQGALAMIGAKAIVGYGPANYVIESPAFWTDDEERWFAENHLMNEHVHNDILEICVDAGVLAGGLYLTFLVLGIRRGVSMARKGDTAERRGMGYMFAAFFVAFLVDGMFGFNLRVPVSAFILFLMAGMLEGLGLAESKDRPAPGPSWRRLVVLGIPAAAVIAGVVLETRHFAAEIYVFRGRSYVEGKAYEIAGPPLRRAHDLAPWMWRIAQYEGVAAVGGGDFEGAVGYFEESLERNPHWIASMVPLTRSHINLASVAPTSEALADTRLQYCREHLASAERQAERILELCYAYGDGEALLGRIALSRAGLVLRQGGEMTPSRQEELIAYAVEAENHFLRGEEFGVTTDPRLYMMLAQARRWRGDTAGARDALIRAVQEDASIDAVWVAFFDISSALGRFDALRDSLKAILEQKLATGEKGPGYIGRLYRHLGRTQEGGYGDLPAAEEAYAAGCEYNPLGPEQWIDYSRFALSSGRTERFARVLFRCIDDLVSEDRPLPPVLQTLNTLWRDGGDHVTKATGELLARLNGPRKPSAEDAKWAVDLLLIHLERRPALIEEQPEGVVNLGLLFINGGDFSTAERLFGAAYAHVALDQKPQCVRYWAASLNGTGGYAQAEVILRDALRQWPGDMGLRFVLAETYEKLNRLDEARSEYSGMLGSPALRGDTRRSVERRLEALSKR